MTWISPEDFERIVRRAEELEDGLEISVLASRPAGRPLRELFAAHELQQSRLRTASIASNVLSLIAIGTVAAGASINVAFIAAGLLAGGLGASIFAGFEARRFKRRVREAGEPRAARK